MDLQTRINEAIAYVAEKVTEPLPVGKYPINEYAYFMVQEYQSKPEDICKLEAHRKFVDVQWILSGKEMIKTYPVSQLISKTDYNPDKDVQFFEPVANMMQMVLSDGSLTVLYPNDAHMPGIAVGAPTPVRKVVIKISCL